MDDPGSTSVPTGGGPLRVRLHGDEGSWVVCLHGFPDDARPPVLAAGQEELFTAPHHAETWPGVGHFPHHETPARSRGAVADRLHRFAVPQESTP